jgi:CheY-like chemotaxis protein
MTETSRVLVVTDDADTRDLWTASLELAGYDTDTCLGPGDTRDCPRLHGARCIDREGAEVAVVDLDCDEDALACTKVPDDGGTVFVRRSASSPSGRGAVLQAVEDAKRHVVDLHGVVVQDRPIPALDVD